MRVQLYDPSWKERVIRLTLHEYPFMESWFSKRFEALYEHPLQEGRSRILLATEGEALAGMVSYVYWPIEGTEKACCCYQMIGALVSQHYRGKGVFAALLEAMKQAGLDDKADYLIGFPVTASKPAFVKKGWTHVFDLIWYIRPLSILAALRRRAFNGSTFSSEVPEQLESDGFMQTAADSNFWNYRVGLMPEWPSWWHEFKKDGYCVCIQFRMGVRKGFNEAIIGKIYPGSAPATMIRAALRSLFGALRKEGSTVFVSLALNPSCRTETLKTVEKMFLKTGKQIHFINMSFTGKTHGFSAKDWNLMRGDIDTW